MPKKVTMTPFPCTNPPVPGTDCQLQPRSIYSSSMSLCLAVTFFWNSAGSLSQSSAASPFNGEALGFPLAYSHDRNTFRTRYDILVWFSEQTLQAQQNSLDIVASSPLILQNIKADSTREIDVGVVYWSLEEDCWRCVWVVGWESERKLKGKPGVWGIIWTRDGSSPGEEVSISRREGRDTRR